MFEERFLFGTQQQYRINSIHPKTHMPIVDVCMCMREREIETTTIPMLLPGARYNIGFALHLPENGRKCESTFNSLCQIGDLPNQQFSRKSMRNRTQNAYVWMGINGITRAIMRVYRNQKLSTR